MAQNSILLLGDSLSASYGMKQNEGWVALLNKQLAKENAPYSIINASISGETTEGGLARLPAILAKGEYDYLLIELGGNDGLRGFPPNLIKKNLLQMINLAKNNDVQVLLSNVRIPPNYGPRYSQMFADVFTATAKQTNTPLLPFFVEKIALNPDYMQADGIHPTKEAQPLLAQQMKEYLDQYVK